MSKKTNVWMPLYIADYLADTTRLTTEQHGAYLLLIMDYWRNGPLPDDDGALANITRLPAAQWKKHRATLARLFDVDGGEWRHKRIDTELARATANVEQRSAAGKASAAKRKKQREAQQEGDGNSTDVATDVETEAQRTGQQNAKPSPSTPTTEGKPSSVGGSRARTSAHDDDPPSKSSAPTMLEPTFEHRGIAHNMGLDLLAERDKFLDHYRATGGLFADWDAAFSKWLRNAHKHGDSKFQQHHPRRPGTSGASLSDQNREAAERAKRRLFGDGDPHQEQTP